MDDETPQSPGKPSQVPSWVTLGFILGALFVLALPRHAPERAPVPTLVPVDPVPAKPVAAPGLSTIDAVFAQWGGYAVWSEGTSEVALWNAGTKSFSDFYEVVKQGEEYYFRPIPSLTRPILTHGVAENSPLQFTETLRQREEWLGEVRKDNWKEFTEGAHPTEPPVVKKANGD